MPVPNDTKEELMRGTFDLPNDTLRVLLLDDSQSYSFDPDAHEFVSDVLNAGTEMSGTTYSRQTLSGVSVSEDTGDDEGVFDADDTTFSGLDEGTIQAIVVYKQVGGDDTTPGDDPVLVVLDDSHVADLPLPTTGEGTTIKWDAEGILNIA